MRIDSKTPSIRQAAKPDTGHLIRKKDSARAFMADAFAVNPVLQKAVFQRLMLTHGIFDIQIDHVNQDFRVCGIKLRPHAFDHFLPNLLLRIPISNAPLKRQVTGLFCHHAASAGSLPAMPRMAASVYHRGKYFSVFPLNHLCPLLCFLRSGFFSVSRAE
ncbi:MAG: hypothetical protein E7325_12085 [Clostridiales bacterium]|nr:hypothetical protein [Clostridiales bacterium]